MAGVTTMAGVTIMAGAIITAGGIIVTGGTTDGVTTAGTIVTGPAGNTRIARTAGAVSRGPFAFARG